MTAPARARACRRWIEGLAVTPWLGAADRGAWARAACPARRRAVPVGPPPSVRPGPREPATPRRPLRRPPSSRASPAPSRIATRRCSRRARPRARRRLAGSRDVPGAAITRSTPGASPRVLTRRGCCPETGGPTTARRPCPSRRSVPWGFTEGRRRLTVTPFRCKRVGHGGHTRPARAGDDLHRPAPGRPGGPGCVPAHNRASRRRVEIRMRPRSHATARRGPAAGTVRQDGRGRATEDVG